jgi:hypothetical protein
LKEVFNADEQDEDQNEEEEEDPGDDDDGDFDAPDAPRFGARSLPPQKRPLPRQSQDEDFHLQEGPTKHHHQQAQAAALTTTTGTQEARPDRPD